MSLFNLFKKKKQALKIKQCLDKISYNFTNEQLIAFIDKAITGFYDNKDSKSEDIIIMLERITGGDSKCARAIYNFIPMVLCEKRFPEPEYPDSYIIFKNGDNCTEHLLANNQLYIVAEKFLQTKLDNNQISSDEVYAILAHSSKFDALSQALDGGSQLGDLVLSPSIFFDTEQC